MAVSRPTREARSLRGQTISSGEAKRPRRTLDPDEVTRRRRMHAKEGPKTALRFEAYQTLQVGWKEGERLAARRGVVFDGMPPIGAGWDEGERLAALARAFFDAVPPSALVISPTASPRAGFKRALNVCIAIVGLAVLEHRVGSTVVEHRSDLEPLLFSLCAGRDAVSERDRGFEEPLLRPSRRSPDMPREDLHAREAKSMSGMACYVLVSFGVPKSVAGRKVAKVVNDSGFLGKGAGGRSILNWMSRWQKLDGLPYLGYCTYVFCDAYNLADKGRSEAAQREVLRVLAEFLADCTADRRSLSMETTPVY
jgi:hypothetical protein